ncbi:hypothetical protein HCH_04471 [Hahella chejuensis KCTC 2396]|uniref:Uncharacterized protein n=1 Tax=Hahella chejuensis (strain KCTC 2396) TaxID=349521 RepID=Q2SDU9_HAHCH|nr:hypothetical protein [Hahella chejuensis]ABC31175.1 hypothetical protein HCH_04471 [Hahella chejuensis KCTC 2396]
MRMISSLAICGVFLCSGVASAIAIDGAAPPWLEMKNNYLSNMSNGCISAHSGQGEGTEAVADYCSCVVKRVDKELTLDDIRYFAEQGRPNSSHTEVIVSAIQACGESK